MGVRDVTKHEGEFYYSVGGASRKLHTSIKKVRQLIMEKELEHTQLKVNGRLLIPLQSLVEYMHRKEDQG